MLGTPLPAWLVVLAHAFRVAQLVALSVALGWLLVIALTEPADAPVFTTTHTPWRP